MVFTREVMGDPSVAKMLSERFVPVTLQNSRPLSAEDEKFWQGVPRIGNGTVLIGAATAGGTPFTPAPNQGTAPWDLVRWFKAILDAYKPETNPALPAGNGNMLAKAPEGTLVLYVTLKVLGLEKLADPYKDGLGNRPFMMRTTDVDRLWVRKDEADALVRGSFPESLKRRLASSHFVWAGGLKQLDLMYRDGRLTGSVESGTADGDQGFQAAIRGAVEAKNGRLTRFDVVAKGLWWA